MFLFKLHFPEAPAAPRILSVLAKCLAQYLTTLLLNTSDTLYKAHNTCVLLLLILIIFVYFYC